MFEMGLNDVYASIEDALSKQDFNKAGNLLWPALDQFRFDAQLWFYASHILVQKDQYAQAELAGWRSAELHPNGRVYGNLGAIYRRMNDNVMAEKMLDLAIEYEPNEKNAWNNKAANFVNEGNPDPGIQAAKRALEIDPNFTKASWNLGLLYLEKGNFGEGWDRYRDGLVLQDRMLRSYSKGEGDGPKLLESLEELTHFEQANGKKARVIVWGEQGIGDEIMFSTMLEDFSKYADIVLECHPRLIEIFKDSYPFIKEFHPTRKEDWVEWPLKEGFVPCEYKCAIGDLGRWLRRDRMAFELASRKQSPFIRADADLVQSYREVLEQISGPDKHYIGVAWTGGVLRTMRWYRSCQLDELYDLANRDDIVLVSLQYEDDALAIEQFTKRTGKQMLRFPAVTQHYNYKHTLALVMALDEVVTVCQSVAHLSAAAGQVTRVLVPDKPAWRYGLEGEDWFWYGENAKLYRRRDQDWSDAILNVMVDIGVGPMPAHEHRLLEGTMKPGYRMLELGAKQAGRYKQWFRKKGIEHVSVDLNGTGDSLELDLQEPLGLGEFDIVTNFGTTEHVENQEPVWRNIHEALIVGGKLISTTPYPNAKGWEKHGKWYPDLLWYKAFADANGYAVEILGVLPDAHGRDMACVRLDKVENKPFEMPDYPIFENVGDVKVGAYV